MVIGKPINTNRWNRIRYTLWAPIYDWIAAVPAHRRRGIELLDLHPGEEVLLVGAGTGSDLLYIPPGVRVVAGDITPAMVERIQRRAAGLGRPVEARVMDGQALDLPSDRFDAVILHLVLAVIPDPVATIQEAARVLKPGGRLVIWDKFVPEGEGPLALLFRRLLNLFTNLLFSNINRRLQPLLAAVPLQVEREEWVRVLGVPFVRLLLRKPAEPRRLP